MNILDLQNENELINQYLKNLDKTIDMNDTENLKMCLKGHLLKSLEHQWKQPLNYISTNLLHLEINAELEKLDLKTVNEFNQNIENAIQSISDNISFYNKLFVTSNKKNNFFLHNIKNNYFNIVQHKIRNNDIHFDYHHFVNNEIPLHNYENETALEIVLLLLIFSDLLITKNQPHITMKLTAQTQNQFIFIELEINTLFTQDELFDKHILHWKVLTQLMLKTNAKLNVKGFNEHTTITYQLDI